MVDNLLQLTPKHVLQRSSNTDLCQAKLAKCQAAKLGG